MSIWVLRRAKICPANLPGSMNLAHGTPAPSVAFSVGHPPTLCKFCLCPGGTQAALVTGTSALEVGQKRAQVASGSAGSVPVPRHTPGNRGGSALAPRAAARHKYLQEPPCDPHTAPGEAATRDICSPASVPHPSRWLCLPSASTSWWHLQLLSKDGGKRSRMDPQRGFCGE